MTEYLQSNQIYKTPLKDEDSRDSGIGLDDTPSSTVLGSIDTSRPFLRFSQVKIQTRTFIENTFQHGLYIKVALSNVM